VFEELGGFDEALAVDYNDLDFCIRLRKKGYLIVWTPFAELYHLETATRPRHDDRMQGDRFQRERNYPVFGRRWDQSQRRKAESLESLSLLRAAPNRAAIPLSDSPDSSFRPPVSQA
jgi:hypothetical protein